VSAAQPVIRRVREAILSVNGEGAVFGGGVPIGVVRFGGFELRLRVEVKSGVTAMRIERLRRRRMD